MPLVCLIAALCLLLPASAAAAPDARVSIMDDQLLLDEQDPSVVDRHMRRFQLARRRPAARVRVLGPDRAEARTAEQAGNFDAASPTDPRYNFANLDRVVQSAVRARLQGDDLDHHAGAAVGDRATRASTIASGSRSRPSSPCSRARSRRATRTRRTSSRSSTSRTSPAGSQPQSNEARLLRAPPLPPARATPPSPRSGRAARATTILVGELAASGSVNRGPDSSIRPLAFLRAFGCVTRSFRKVRTGRCRDFTAPRADAIGHHPYQFFQRPRSHSRHRDDAAIGDGPRLLRFLDRLVRRGGLISTRGGKARRPLHGVRLPDRPARPVRRHPAQAPGPLAPGGGDGSRGRPRACTPSASSGSRTARSCPGGGFAAYREFQTGLMFRDMRKKPSYASFRHPFVIKRRGKRLRLWGQVRPGGRHDVTIERKRRRQLEEGRDRRDDPSRLLAAQDPQALGHLPLPLGRRQAAHERQHPRPLARLQGFLQDPGTSVRRRSYLHEHMFPTALQRLRLSLRGGVALAVEFATLGELVPEYREPELPGDDSGRSAGRLIGEQARPAVRPSTAAARARLQQRGTVTAVEPECAERVRAPSRQPRRRRPSPPVPAQPCV